MEFLANRPDSRTPYILRLTNERLCNPDTCPIAFYLGATPQPGVDNYSSTFRSKLVCADNDDNHADITLSSSLLTLAQFVTNVVAAGRLDYFERSVRGRPRMGRSCWSLCQSLRSREGRRSAAVGAVLEDVTLDERKERTISGKERKKQVREKKSDGSETHIYTHFRRRHRIR